MATIDGFDCIEIRDRIKDVIKTGGEWISSLELEDLISSHPAIGEVAVVGVPDEQWGERPCAWVITQPGQSVSVEEIKQYLEPFVLKGKINKWAIPTNIKFVTEIPKTSVGKLDKKLIRARTLESFEKVTS